MRYGSFLASEWRSYSSWVFLHLLHAYWVLQLEPYCIGSINPKECLQISKNVYKRPNKSVWAATHVWLLLEPYLARKDGYQIRDGGWRPFWKFQTAISLRRVIRSTTCSVLRWGLRGRRIERRYFRSHLIQDGGGAAILKTWSGHISEKYCPIYLMFGSILGFAWWADQMAPFPVESNPIWRLAAIQTAISLHPIELTFAYWMGFLRWADLTALLSVEPHPRWRPAAIATESQIDSFLISKTEMTHNHRNGSHHRGRHAKIFGWAKSAAWPTLFKRSMAYNSQRWDWEQTEILCDVCKIQ